MEANGSTPQDKGFYKKAVWRKLRAQALERDHYLCQECLRRKRFTRATEVHHIKPLKELPEFGLTLSNLESLCRPCHEATKKRGKRGAAISASVRIIKV